MDISSLLKDRSFDIERSPTCLYFCVVAGVHTGTVPPRMAAAAVFQPLRIWSGMRERSCRNRCRFCSAMR